MKDFVKIFEETVSHGQLDIIKLYMGFNHLNGNGNTDEKITGAMVLKESKGIVDIAISTGNLELIKFVIEECKCDCTAINVLSIQKISDDLLEYLIEKTTINIDNIFMKACETGNVSMVELIIKSKKEKNIDIKEWLKKSTFEESYYTSTGYLATVSKLKYLLSAWKNSHFSVVKIILKYLGNTEILDTTLSDKEKKFIKFLIEN